MRKTGALIVVAVSFASGCAHSLRPRSMQDANEIVGTSEVLIARDAAAWADPTPALVIVVRDVDLPNHAIDRANVAFGLPATDLWKLRRGTRFAQTDSAGTIRPFPADSGWHDVAVRRVGYADLHVRTLLRAGCHQTLELYLGERIVTLDGRANPAPSPGRAVLTTCAPPA